MILCRGVIYHVPNTLKFAERNVIRVVEQSEKITPLQSIITCQKAAILHSKKNDFVKPDEACERYCKREQRKFTFNLSSAAISYPMSEAKFVHARSEKSHFKKEQKNY